MRFLLVNTQAAYMVAFFMIKNMKITQKHQSIDIHPDTEHDVFIQLLTKKGRKHILNISGYMLVKAIIQYSEQFTDIDTKLPVAFDKPQNQK